MTRKKKTGWKGTQSGEGLVAGTVPTLGDEEEEVVVVGGIQPFTTHRGDSQTD